MQYRDPKELKNHPTNIKIYGDKVDPEFVERCRVNGIQAIIITKKNVIISGHRRNQAAKILKLEKVPVIVSPLTDPVEIKREILLHNDSRVKTQEQLGREYTVRKALARLDAKRRQKEHAGTAPGKSGEESPVHSRENTPVNIDQSNRATDQAAEEIGLSRNTAEKLEGVIEAIDKAENLGHIHVAEDLRATLEGKSIEAAHRKATKKPKPESNGEVLDSRNAKVPKKLEPIFSSAKEFSSLARKCSLIISEAQKLSETPAGTRLHMKDVRAELANARRAIKFAMPYALCPYCKGTVTKECGACKGTNWVTEVTWSQAPK